jgi:hypothetical protein
MRKKLLDAKSQKPSGLSFEYDISTGKIHGDVSQETIDKAGSGLGNLLNNLRKDFKDWADKNPKEAAAMGITLTVSGTIATVAYILKHKDA